MNSFSDSYQMMEYLVKYLSLSILFGLVPLFVGIKMGNRLLGIVGLLGCIVAGFFHLGSAVLTAIVFVIIIILKNR